MQNYSTLQETASISGGMGACMADQEESAMVYHVADPSRARWNHIEDLDSFFSRMYKYHQRHGFLCMTLQELLELGQFVFVVSFTTFLVHCVDYPVLFHDKPAAHNSSKVTLSDIMMPMSECSATFGLWTYLILVIAGVVWCLRLLKSIYHMGRYLETKQFFNSALGIPDSELDNYSWNEVQTRARAVQREQQMCIHKRELTELDIYHRILRQHNFLVAMTNKKLLPPRFQVPFIGEVVYWTKGLRYNIQILLFWGPFSPFENPWHLRDEYRKEHLRHELARRLGRHVLWVAAVNLLFAPLVLLWQILFAFFSNTDVIRREPGSLGVRSWSQYGKLYLRHFNELDHELQIRLSRAHRPASRYLSAFSSPVAAVVARSFGFILGAILAVIISLTIYDEDVLNVEHMLLVMTSAGGLVALCRALIPDETIAWCPEALLANVVEHTHYLPDNWKRDACTYRVRSEFQQLFQYRLAGLLEELLSPLITPYVLYRYIYPRTLEFVDFFHNFTVDVVGVGDVCSFAQMNLRKHGNPEWQVPDVAQGAGGGFVEDSSDNTKSTNAAPDQYSQAEAGKTELSLMHFALTNPSWKPPPAEQAFVENIMAESVAVARNLQQRQQQQLQDQSSYFQQQSGDFMLHHNLNDSSIRDPYRSLEAGFNSSVDMGISTAYLHNRNHNHQNLQTTTQSHIAGQHAQQLSRFGPPAQASSAAAVETTPLLFISSGGNNNQGFHTSPGSGGGSSIAK